MALTEKRAEAKQLYIEGMTCAAIAERLGVDAGTVYRWKAADTEQDEAVDWDFQRQLHLLSFEGMVSKYRNALTIAIRKIDEEPERLLDPKIADALLKSLKALEKIDTRGQNLGAIMTFIKVTNRWLSEHQRELKALLDP